MEEKSAWTRLVRAAGVIQASPDFRMLRTHILTLQALWYAPPVTGLQICKQLRLNGCGKNALRSKLAGQYEFAQDLVGAGLCSARWEVTNSPKTSVKPVQSAGPMWASAPTMRL